MFDGGELVKCGYLTLFSEIKGVKDIQKDYYSVYKQKNKNMKRKRNINLKRKSTIYRVKLTKVADVLVEVYLLGELLFERFFKYREIRNK